jgi:hypothetical protein
MASRRKHVARCGTFSLPPEVFSFELSNFEKMYIFLDWFVKLIDLDMYGSCVSFEMNPETSEVLIRTFPEYYKVIRGKHFLHKRRVSHNTSILHTHVKPVYRTLNKVVDID